MPSGWVVEEVAGSPGAFHARALPVPAVRTIWLARPTEAALVLGSAQPPAAADGDACARAGVAVVRRRSGGGAVLVEPGRLLWVDVVVPAGDPLWEADVGRAFLWLGDAWVATLASHGVPAQVHRGGLVTTPWSRVVCFGGLGTGEVTDPAGAKLIGISQRRTREATRFQCAALAAWEPAPLVALLSLTPDERSAAEQDLASRAAGVPMDLEALAVSFVRHLP